MKTALEWFPLALLDVQDYDRTQKPKVEGDTIRVHFPRNQVLGVQTIRMMRQRKREYLQTIQEIFQKKSPPKEA